MYECVVVCIMCGLRFGIRLMIRFLAFNCFRLYEKSSILAEKNMSFVFVFECNLEVRVFYVFLLKLTANHVFLSISQLIFVRCCRKILFEFDSHRVFYLTSVFTVSAISSRLLFFVLRLVRAQADKIQVFAMVQFTSIQFIWHFFNGLCFRYN